MIGGAGEAKTSRTFLESFLHFLYFLPCYLFSTYFFIEVLLPKLLYRQRYVVFLFSFLLLFGTNFICVYYAGALYLHQVFKIPFGQITFNTNKYYAIVDGLFLPFMLFGISTGIMFSKKWLRQQKENEKLTRQKLATELQLLKTSIHPRFLFHALHTVQRHIDNYSEQSPALILQLSDLLSYILYEKDEDWVPVEKEIEIINCYINLEQKSLENALTFRTEFPKNTEGKFLVPFLLLSIVENCFEYFFETAQQGPLLTLMITINENVLHCRVYFSRGPGEVSETNLPGERFLPLQKQLQNQYPGLHQLFVKVDPEVISIDLKLPLYSGDLIIKKNIIQHEEPELL